MVSKFQLDDSSDDDFRIEPPPRVLRAQPRPIAKPISRPPAGIDSFGSSNSRQPANQRAALPRASTLQKPLASRTRVFDASDDSDDEVRHQPKAVAGRRTQGRPQVKPKFDISASSDDEFEIQPPSSRTSATTRRPVTPARGILDSSTNSDEEDYEPPRRQRPVSRTNRPTRAFYASSSEDDTPHRPAPAPAPRTQKLPARAVFDDSSDDFEVPVPRSRVATTMRAPTVQRANFADSSDESEDDSSFLINPPVNESAGGRWFATPQQLSDDLSDEDEFNIPVRKPAKSKTTTAAAAAAAAAKTRRPTKPTIGIFDYSSDEDEDFRRPAPLLKTTSRAPSAPRRTLDDISDDIYHPVASTRSRTQSRPRAHTPARTPASSRASSRAPPSRATSTKRPTRPVPINDGSSDDDSSFRISRQVKSQARPAPAPATSAKSNRTTGRSFKPAGPTLVRGGPMAERTGQVAEITKDDVMGILKQDFTEDQFFDFIVSYSNVSAATIEAFSKLLGQKQRTIIRDMGYLPQIY